jgi:hypothetical protein
MLPQESTPVEIAQAMADLIAATEQAVSDALAA